MRQRHVMVMGLISGAIIVRAAPEGAAHTQCRKFSGRRNSACKVRLILYSRLTGGSKPSRSAFAEETGINKAQNFFTRI